MSLPNPSPHNRAIFATRFMKPPGYLKRAVLRNKPRLRIGPFENPVRRFVRLREKARAFCEIPPPRRIPIPRPVVKKFLQPITGVPTVAPEVLSRRLEFLLSSKASQQQRAEPFIHGCTPFATEKFVWERQMTDIRKIYRAQYIQRLAEVTEEERLRQLSLYNAESQERKMRRDVARRRIFEDRKRRAILKDRLRIEAKVNEAIQMTHHSRVKKKRIATYSHIEKNNQFPLTSPAEDQVAKKEDLFDRNVSTSDIMRQLGLADEKVTKIERKVMKDVLNVFRDTLVDSYDLLGEDEPQFEAVQPQSSEMTERRRAHIAYSGFTEEEKLKVLEEKIELIKKKLDDAGSLRAGVGSAVYGQLLDKLEASKFAYLEKRKRQEEQKKTEGP